MCPSFVRVGWREIAQQDFAARDFRKIFEAQRSAWLRSQCPRSHNDEGERGKAGDEASHRPQYKTPGHIHRRLSLADPTLASKRMW